MIVRKTQDEIDTMARAGAVVVEALAAIEDAIAPGVTTAELDAIADRLIRGHGGVPSFKGYRGFPASICASPNDMVVHGIPGSYTLEDGDVISIDVGVTLDGFVAGDDVGAKQAALSLVESLGFRPIDAGPLAMARALEGMGTLNISLNMANDWPWQTGWKLVGPTG